MTKAVRIVCMIGIVLILFRDQIADLIDVVPLPVPEPQVIVGDGFSVLIVEETQNRHHLPEGQREILGSVRLRRWFAQNGIDWRVDDQDDPLVNAEQKWQDAIRQPRSSVPWIYATNGGKSLSEPLPMSVDETIAKLEELIDG